jgi:hypothetical protein
MTDTNNIAQAITVLRAAFPRQEISSKAFGDMVALWAEILADIPPNVLNMAVMEWIARDTPWFPSVGQIRHIALDLVQCKEGELTPGEGWEEVKRAIRIGRHCFQAGSVKWSSLLVEKAFNALGGWNYFRIALQEDEVARVTAASWEACTMSSSEAAARSMAARSAPPNSAAPAR